MSCVLVSSAIRWGATTCVGPTRRRSASGAPSRAGVPDLAVAAEQRKRRTAEAPRPATAWELKSALHAASRNLRRKGTRSREAGPTLPAPRPARRSGGWSDAAPAQSSVISDVPPTETRAQGRHTSHPAARACRAVPVRARGNRRRRLRLSPAATREHEQADRDEQRRTPPVGAVAATLQPPPPPPPPLVAGRAAAAAARWCNRPRPGASHGAGERAVGAQRTSRRCPCTCSRRWSCTSRPSLRGTSRPPCIRDSRRRSSRTRRLRTWASRRTGCRSCSSRGCSERPPFQPRTGRRAR